MTNRRAWLFALFIVTLPTQWAYANCELELAVAFDHIPAPKPDKNSILVNDQIPMTKESLIAAYSRGIFPWSVTDEGNARWFVLQRRGLLDFANLHLPPRDRDSIQRVGGIYFFERLAQMQNELREGLPIYAGRYRITFDQSFREVMEECRNQPRDDDMWITEQHLDEYTKLNALGKAHSVEVWDGEELVAGMYGVFINGVYSGESMFHKRSDVLKLAYLVLIEKLKLNGHTFIDTQMNVGLTKQWGGKEVPIAEFQSRLAEAALAQKLW